MPQLDSDGFIVVRHKFKSKVISQHALQKGCAPPTQLKPDNLDVKIIIKKVDECFEWLQDSSYLHRFLSTLGTCLRVVSGTSSSPPSLDPVRLVLCYGLGHVAVSPASQLQLALLLHIKRFLTSDHDLTDCRQAANPVGGELTVELFDPVFWPQEIDALRHYQLNVLAVNERCGRRLSRATIVYMPHCENEHSEALLAANWHPQQLARCVLIGNCMRAVALRLPPSLLAALPLTARVAQQPQLAPAAVSVDESPERRQRLLAAFNDTAVHCFPADALRQLPGYFWSDPPPPAEQDATWKMSLLEGNDHRSSDEQQDERLSRRRRRRRARKTRLLH